jgi:hypothetical protein
MSYIPGIGHIAKYTRMGFGDCEPPEPEPTLDGIPACIHEEQRKHVEEDFKELDDDEAREAFTEWLVEKGEEEMVWEVLANNLHLMRLFAQSDIGKKIIDRRKDERITKFYLEGRK